MADRPASQNSFRRQLRHGWLTRGLERAVCEPISPREHGLSLSQSQQRVASAT